MSTATLVSVEECLANGDKPTPEYLEGILRPRSTPTQLHSLVQHFLVVLLRQMGLSALPETGPPGLSRSARNIMPGVFRTAG